MPISPNNEYLCDKCPEESREPLQKVWLVPRREYIYGKDQNTGKPIVVQVKVHKDEQIVLCEKHYEEDLRAEQIQVHRHRV